MSVAGLKKQFHKATQVARLCDDEEKKEEEEEDSDVGDVGSSRYTLQMTFRTEQHRRCSSLMRMLLRLHAQGGLIKLSPLVPLICTTAALNCVPYYAAPGLGTLGDYYHPETAAVGAGSSHPHTSEQERRRREEEEEEEAWEAWEAEGGGEHQRRQHTPCEPHIGRHERPYGNVFPFCTDVHQDSKMKRL
ncbi:hypothetical protein EYF80_000050 [Liparis tanakae]|uniref:Uncharacterized protein n=1 Tax=Liparis tanakae TaxID=230148 RepID=A0A4Z2JHL7_9TELE|nr:hypothetical protein EYF80_000050 [Liparis tanakae]